MQLRLLVATSVIAALIGACQREPLAPGQIPTGAVGGTAIGGRAGQVTTGVGGDGAVAGRTGGDATAGAGGDGVGGASLGGTGAGGASSGGAGVSGAGGSGGTGDAGGLPECLATVGNGLPCSLDHPCSGVQCQACSDQYWVRTNASRCVCDPTGVWSCLRLPPVGVDCFFDQPLDCAIAQSLYEDPTCQTHPACEPN